MNVGKNIAKLRKEKKLTQEELAKKINVSPKTISIIPMIYFSINEYIVGDTVISVYEKTGVLEPENIMAIIKVSTFEYIIIIIIGLFMYWFYKKNKNKILLFIAGVVLLLTIPEVFHFYIYNFEVYIYTLLGIIGLIFSIKGLLKKEK